MQSQLNINIDSEGLNQIRNRGGLIVISNHAIPPGGLSTAWLAFLAGSHNVVSWSEAYDIYTSTQASLTPGMSITAAARTPARPGDTFALLSDGSFSRTSGGDPRGILLRNETNAMKLVGTYGTAVVNGQPVSAACNAAMVMPYNQILFSPVSAVRVFVADSVQNGTVLDEIPGNAPTVQLAGGAVSLTYNSATGAFDQR